MLAAHDLDLGQDNMLNKGMKCVFFGTRIGVFFIFFLFDNLANERHVGQFQGRITCMLSVHVK